MDFCVLSRDILGEMVIEDLWYLVVLVEIRRRGFYYVRNLQPTVARLFGKLKIEEDTSLTLLIV